MTAAGSDLGIFGSEFAAAADGLSWSDVPVFPAQRFGKRQQGSQCFRLPAGPLSLDMTDGSTLRAADRNLVLRAKSPIEARCILYCSFCGMEEVALPPNALSVFRTVKRFEAKLRSVYDRAAGALHKGVLGASPFRPPHVAVLARLALCRAPNPAESVERLLQFIHHSPMVMSYKPVFLLSLLHSLGTDGRANVETVTQQFAEFYRQRRREGLLVERQGARTALIQSLPLGEIRSVMLAMPLERFRQQGFVDLENTRDQISLSRPLWAAFDLSGFLRCAKLCWQKIGVYYARLA